MNVLAALGGCGYLHISISSAQHRGWCRRAPRVVSTSVLSVARTKVGAEKMSMSGTSVG